MKIVYIFFLLFSVNNLYCQDLGKKSDLKMEIVFQDFFKNDTITLKVNNIKIIDKVITTSDEVLGVTNLQFDFINDRILNRYDKENKIVISNSKIKLKSIVSVEIIINGQKKYFEIDLNQGKHLGFNNYKELKLNQSKFPFMYD